MNLLTYDTIIFELICYDTMLQNNDDKSKAELLQIQQKIQPKFGTITANLAVLGVRAFKSNCFQCFVI